MPQSRKTSNRRKSRATPHTNVVISHEMRNDLYKALLRRAEIGKAHGQMLPTTFGGWVREQAMATIQAYR